MRRIFPPAHIEADKGHGRIEIRKIQTTTVLNDYVKFPHVAQICRIERTTYNLNGKLRCNDVVFAVTSLPREIADAKKLLEINRGHWCIENRLHWVRDVTFDEDRSQVRTGEGARTMATLRNLAISLFRLQGIKNIAQALRSYCRKAERAVRLLGL